MCMTIVKTDKGKHSQNCEQSRGLQYLAGLSAFLIPKAPGAQKAAYSPIHIFFGRTTYVLGLATMTVSQSLNQLC